MEWQNAFPELIEQFSGLDDHAVQAYIDAINAAGVERLAAADRLTDADLDEMETFRASAQAAEGHLADLAAAKAAREARVASMSFKPSAAPPPAPPAAPTMSAPPVKVVEEPPCTDCGTDEFSIYPEIVVTSKVGRFAEGERVTTLAEQGEALLDRAKRLANSRTNEKFAVLQVRNYIPEDLHMPADGIQAFGFLNNDRYDEEGLVASFCAPPTVDYGFCGGSSPARPVLGALRRYQAPRGRVTKVRTPLFSSVGTDPDEVDDTGLGFWTNADDSLTGEEFVNKLCSVMTCPTDEDFELYSTYKCLTIKNFMQLAYPEWVAFYNQQLDALWARAAERQLLDQIIARAGAAITTTATYGALATLVSRLNLTMNNYTENERYDSSGLMAIMPRWVITMLKNDAIRRGQTLTTGQITAALADVGINRVVWTYDNPTAYGDYTVQNKGAGLVALPSTAWCVLSRADNLRVMDFGATDIGVTTEREYRDTASNLRNDFQIFVESFEGILDMGCPTWLLEIPLCDNGIIAPVSGYGTEPCGDDDEFDDEVGEGDV